MADLSNLSTQQKAVMLQLPVMKPPPDAETILRTHAPKQTWFYMTAALCITIPGFLICLRGYTKIVIVRKLDVADWFIAFGFASLIAAIVFGRIGVGHGFGLYLWQIHWADWLEQLRLNAYAGILFGPVTFLVKVSIILQYLKIFAPLTTSANRTVFPCMFYGSWVIIGFNLVANFTAPFLLIFRCHPIARGWNPFVPGRCLFDAIQLVLPSCIFNMSTDVAMILLPAFQLWRLRIPTNRKLVILFLFSTGLLASVASAMRIVYVLRGYEPHNHDLSVDGLSFTLWSYAELSLVLVVSSVLTLPTLFKSRQKLAKKLQHRRWIKLHSIRDQHDDEIGGGRELQNEQELVEQRQTEIGFITMPDNLRSPEVV